jgi:hypothetical protein
MTGEQRREARERLTWTRFELRANQLTGRDSSGAARTQAPETAGLELIFDLFENLARAFDKALCKFLRKVILLDAKVTCEVVTV